ncbi:MAG: 50S ribosomal protein L10 [Desulfopila sp.]
MNRDEKATIISELNDSFSRAKFAVVADYCGLKVSELQQVRIELRKCDSEIRVAKNTLLKRAAADTDNAVLSEHFTGTTAVIMAYGDPVGPAKVVAKFAEDHEKFAIRCAALEGGILEHAGIVALSKLPTKEVLLAQFLSVLNSVPTGLVQVLSGVPRTFGYVLNAVREKKEQTAA